MLRKFLVSCLALFFVALSPLSWATPQIDAPIAALIDGESGALIFEKNSHKIINPEDLTCLMSLYTALKLSQEPNKLQSLVTVDFENDKKISLSRRIYLATGMKVPLSTLLRSIAVIGAEDSSLAVAQFLSGSYRAFVEKMNFYAKEIGMKDSLFAFPISSANQVTSAYDLSLLANRIRIEFPTAYAWFSETEFSFAGHTQKNGNLALWKSSSINGVMASSTNLNIISSWLRTESNKVVPRSLISVVLQGKNREKTVDESFNLLREGWINYETIMLFDDKATIARLDVVKGNRDKLEVGFSRAIWVTVPHKLLVTRGTGGFSTQVVYMHPLVAPIKEGALVGTLNVTFEQQHIASFPLYAKHDIGLGGFISRLVDTVRLKTEESYSPAK